MPDEFEVKTSYNKPNTQPQETETPDENKIEGKVTLRKKSLGQKFLDSILADDILALKDSLWNNVLIPKIQDFLCDSVQTLFHKNGRASSGGGGTNYNSISRPTQANPDPRRIYSLSGGSIQSTLNDVMLYSLEDVKRLYVFMKDYIEMNGFITVGVLYRKLGLPSDQAKENWGWFNITQDTFGYFKRYDEDGNVVYGLKLPKPEWVRQ